MNRRHLCVSLCIGLLFMLATALHGAGPNNLRCEYRENPLGIAAVTASGKSAVKAKGVKFLRMENGTAIFAVGSGIYTFQSTIPEVIK